MNRVFALGSASLVLFLGRAEAGEVSPYALIQVDTNHVASLRSRGSIPVSEVDQTVTDIRRATVGFEGDLGRNLTWEIGYDLKQRAFRDVFATVTWRKAHSIAAGQFKQPVIMDELSSSRTSDFIASSTVADVFAVSRRVGVAYQFRNDHGGVTISLHGRELGNDGDTGWGRAARAYRSPRQWKDGFLHLGGSLSSTNGSGPVRYRVRPNADLLSLRILDVRSAHPCAPCDVRIDVAAPELAVVHGRLKVQSEVLRVRMHQHSLASEPAKYAIDARGGYISLMWMPGDQHWSYRDGLIITPRLAPGESLWQLGVRYDWIALDPDGAGESTLRIATAGMNLYMGQRWKLSFNIVDANARRPVNGTTQSPVVGRLLESRLQFAW
jgi:phosphate-selective porin OprO/OprP